MDEMLRYLFKSTMRTDSALRAVAKTLRTQHRFNRLVILTYLTLGIGYLENQRELVAMKHEIDLIKEPTESTKDETRR